MQTFCLSAQPHVQIASFHSSSNVPLASVLARTATLFRVPTVPVKGYSAGITGGGVAGVGHHTCGDESGMQTAKRREGGQWKRRGG